MRSSLYTQTHAVPALTPVVRTANTTVNGTTVDTSMFGNDFRAVLFVITAGAITDGTHTFAVQDSADGSAWAAADSAQIQGALPALTTADANKVFYLGYLVGTRPYVRLTVTTAAATSGGLFGAAAVCSSASSSPVARS